MAQARPVYESKIFSILALKEKKSKKKQEKGKSFSVAVSECKKPLRRSFERERATKRGLALVSHVLLKEKHTLLWAEKIQVSSASDWSKSSSE